MQSCHLLHFYFWRKLYCFFFFLTPYFSRVSIGIILASCTFEIQKIIYFILQSCIFSRKVRKANKPAICKNMYIVYVCTTLCNYNGDFKNQLHSVYVILYYIFIDICWFFELRKHITLLT